MCGMKSAWCNSKAIACDVLIKHTLNWISSFKMCATRTATAMNVCVCVLQSEYDPI